MIIPIRWPIRDIKRLFVHIPRCMESLFSLGMPGRKMDLPDGRAERMEIFSYFVLDEKGRKQCTEQTRINDIVG